MLFKQKLFFGKCGAGSGKSGVAIWPALTTVTAALSPAVAAQRARRSLRNRWTFRGVRGVPAWGAGGSREGGGRGSRAGAVSGHQPHRSTARTEEHHGGPAVASGVAGDAAPPTQRLGPGMSCCLGGRVHMGCLPPTPRTPPRRRRLRACPWRFGPVLEFGLGRCPRLCCGCWPWFSGASCGGFRAGVFLTGALRSVWPVGGRTAGRPGWGPDCPLRRGRRLPRPPPSTPSPAGGPWCGLSWATEIPADRRV
jgi:hypothetical protein